MKKIITRDVPSGVPILHSHPVLHRVYAARGVTNTLELEHTFTRLLPHQNLSGIEAAVKCLADAIKERKRILILGDFDADGATSTAVGVLALRVLGAAQVDYLIPNRFEFGYGLTPEIVKVAAAKQPDVIVTVDNGVASIDGVKTANSLGMKVVITDHHLPGAELPEACAIVNPNLNGDSFASKHLAGVGVIFYVMLALRSYLRSIDWFSSNNLSEPNMAQFLDLVALGTVADVVPLDHNNRILVAQGLERIRAGKCRIGIKELLAVTNRHYARALLSDLGFVIAPRINAAGRLDEMSLGVECLLTEDVVAARKMAKELHTLNSERREIEADMQRQAARILDNLRLEQDLPLGLCVFEESWHQGVLGILASRLKDKLRRPVIAFAAVNDNEIKGSARSVAGVHIRDVLSSIAARNPELIAKFGGHAMAAGLTVARENYEQFTQAFALEVAEHLAGCDLRNTIFTDGELPSEYFTLAMAELLRAGGPWGQGFPEPLFCDVFTLVNQRLVGQKHLKLTLRHDACRQDLDAVWFNIDTNVWPNFRCNQARLVYRLDVNEYNGQKNLQLIVEHLESS